MFAFTQVKPKTDGLVMRAQGIGFLDFLAEEKNEGTYNSGMANLQRYNELELEKTGESLFGMLKWDNGTKLSPEEANKRFALPGLQFNEPIYEGAARLMHERAIARADREFVLEYGAKNGRSLIGWPVQMVASMLTPLDAGLMFLPIIGEAGKVAEGAATMGAARRVFNGGLFKMEQSTLGSRILRTSVEAAAGQAILEIPTTLAHHSEGLKYDLGDSFRNVALGGLFGAGLRVGGEAILAPLLKRAAGIFGHLSPATKDAMAQVAMDQHLKDQPPNVHELATIDPDHIRAEFKFDEAKAREEALAELRASEAGSANAGSGDVAAGGGRTLEKAKALGVGEELTKIKQAPEPEVFNSVDDVLKFRERRLLEQRQLFVEQIGISMSEAERLQSLLSRESNLARFERTLTQAQRDKLESFFEGPLNQRDSHFKTWEINPRLNPSDIARETDPERLVSALVEAIHGGAHASANNDTFLSAFIAATRLKEVGGTMADIARHLDSYSTRSASSAGDKLDFFKMLGEKVKGFLASQGIDIPVGNVKPGSDAAALIGDGMKAELKAKEEALSARVAAEQERRITELVNRKREEARAKHPAEVMRQLREQAGEKLISDEDLKRYGVNKTDAAISMLDEDISALRKQLGEEVPKQEGNQIDMEKVVNAAAECVLNHG